MVNSLVPQPQRARASGVASLYRRVAGRIGDDLDTPKQIRDTTKDETLSLLGPDASAWLPFFEELAGLLYTWDQQQQRDLDDFKTMWKAIADGVERKSVPRYP